MKRFIAVLSLFALCFASSSSVFAGLIVLSGDSNIANALDGSSGVTVNANNQLFFKNVLGSGTNVLVQQTSGAGSPSVAVSDTAINTYYNSLAGVSSSLYSGVVDETALSGLNLYVGTLPDDTYTATEVAALSAFLGAGGSIFLLGENNYAATNNGYINTLLSDFGSSMSITSVSGVSGATPLSDPLTSGVGSITYLAGSTVSGGTTLFVTSGQTPVIAYENVGGNTVPEPGTVALLCLGLAGLAASRRQKQ